MDIVFYIAAAVAVFSTMMVITRLNAIHALLYLIVSLFSVAIVFYLLGAPFVSALEVIIYAGAIMVLFVFAVMTLNLGEASIRQEERMLSGGAWVGPTILSLILLAELVFILWQPRVAGSKSILEKNLHEKIISVGPKAIGASLFGPYLIGAEITGMLLLAGLVGAYHISRRDRTGEGEKQ